MNFDGAFGIGVVSGLGANVRFYRTIMLDEMYKDYVRTAWSKGLGERQVLFRHILKNALIPFITVLAIHLPQIFTGAIVVETLFGWPGIGRLYWQSALNCDYPVLMGVMAISAVSIPTPPLGTGG